MQRMDRLRRSLRDSFRRKREAPESSKPHQWQADEEAVRSGTCSFNVKYLGCVEVFESRGMQVCEEAMKVLRQSRRRPVKAVLHVSGDGLRVVEDDTKGLIVDQTIEKVSFCAPDRNHERGFSYICRDGTTRRWMCHGFLATKESGERLSHAVGCAFAACLERKQKREKEIGVSMSYDPKTSTFTRSGSFRVGTLTDGSNGSHSGPAAEVGPASGKGVVRSSSVVNTHAIERPHAPAKMLERQGSFRGFSQLANQSPFKRQLSLRLSDLPSNLQRTQNNVDILTNNNVVVPVDPLMPTAVNASPTPPPRTQRNRLHSLPNNSLGGPGVIPEGTGIHLKGIMGSKTSVVDNKDLVSELCQQVTQGLSLLAANHDDLKGESSTNQFPTKFTNPWDDEVEIGTSAPTGAPGTAAPLASLFGRIGNPLSTTSATTSSPPLIPKADQWTSSLPNKLAGALNQITKTVEKGTPGLTDGIIGDGTNKPTVNAGSQPPTSAISMLPSTTLTSGTTSSTNAAAAVSSSWTSPLVSSSTTASTAATNTANNSASKIPLTTTTTNTPPRIPPSPSRPPLISTASIATPPSATNPGLARRGPPSRSHSLGADPFDADWAAPVARTGQAPTNPFVRQQTFQVSM